ncbi:hypothetical protein VZC37_22885 [Gordonia sp. LSe1-13]|uniref:Helix-turn-helix domain-containing protein n=1 Tax=Gordonia sesuvii TaxID=3116777 RepID=A0ABU7MKP7_9ACTN|nr:hypothetical protein [Gordonia sp. LSe1-13]
MTADPVAIARALRAEAQLWTKDERKYLTALADRLAAAEPTPEPTRRVPVSSGSGPGSDIDLSGLDPAAAARTLRAHGLTYPEMSQRLEVSQSTVRRWIHGRPY